MNRVDVGQLARARARQVLKSLCIEDPDEIDIVAIAAHHDLFVRIGGIEGAEGRLVSSKDRGVIRIRADINQPARRRYIIAHELGHFILHARDATLSACTERALNNYGSDDVEGEANWFAAELLMPAAMFSPHCDVKQPSMAVVRALAEQFQTTVTASTIRFVDLCPEPCAVVWCEGAVVKWAICSREMHGWAPRGHRLSSYAHAYDAFRGRRLPTGPQLVPADAWLTQAGGDIYEESLWFPSLSATLTLLWQPVASED